MATKDWNGFKKSGDTFIPNDATARANITAIKDGTNIDSFGDVETALAGKADKFGVDGLTIDWLQGVGIPDKLYVMEHDEIPQENEWINGLPNDEAVRKAVKSAYDLMEDTVGWINRNEFEPSTPSNQTHGVTASITNDKRVSLTGTSDIAHILSIGDFTCKANVKYILNGCPSGGGTESSNYWLDAYIVATSTIVNKDTGSGCELLFNADTTVRIRIRIPKGLNTAGMVYSPMLRKADILDATYEPYRGTTAFPRDEQAVLGVKNLYPKYVGSRTDQNVTYTADETGVVSCVGVASNSALWRQDSLTLKAGKYILSGGEGIGTYNSSSFNALVELYNPSTSAYIAPDTGTEDTYTFATDTVVQPTLRVQSGVDSSGYTFYPMLRLATDTDDTYVPYAMTNRELTNKVQGILDAAANAADFAAFQAALAAL